MNEQETLQLISRMKGEVNHREALGFWLNKFGLVKVGAEIGCAYGGLARIMSVQWQGEKYWMIDPWKPQDKEIYKERQETKEKYESWFEDCASLSKVDPRFTLLRKLSVKAAPMFENNSLDFAYIDGNHAYPNVLEDMDLWWPKVKPNGILAGHDFYTTTGHGVFNEVEAAVNLWTKEHALKFTVTPCSSWWIYKK